MTEREEDDDYVEIPAIYPFETLRRSYVTRFGGRSPDLTFDEVGINGEALFRNTDLRPGDAVTVGILGEGKTRPYLLEPLYTVTGLDPGTPDAFQKSCLGEAVFSADVEASGRRVDLFRRGELVVLSAVLSDQKTGKGWRLELLPDVLRELKIIQN